jgi:hypothetical protein
LPARAISTATARPTSSGAARATVDLDGDGKSDILWRGGDGSVYLWRGGGLDAAGGVSLGVVDSHWVIRSVQDLDGDGKADILWRLATTGPTYVWLMDGAVATSAAYTTSNATLEWEIQPAP